MINRVPCSVCGTPTWSKYGVCYRPKTPCMTAYTAARDKNRGIKKVMLVNAKQRAKRRGIPFNLTEEDFEIPVTCPVLGYTLEKGVGTNQPNSPSLDQVIPGIGYVPGNVQVISLKANFMKQDATPDELKRFCRYYIGDGSNQVR